MQDEWRAWVLSRTWRADRELDQWVDAAIGTHHASRDGQPTRVSKNFAVLLRELAYSYEVAVVFEHGVGGWCVTVGRESDYEEQSHRHETIEIALAVATLLYFHPPERWLETQKVAV